MKRAFTASLEQLRDMLEFISEQARESGADQASLGKIELASEEALVNIVNYSYPQQEGQIEISCDGEGKQRLFRVAIHDQGIPYNLVGCMRTPRKTAPSVDPVLGGYGIFLMLQLMDGVDYRRIDNNTNELILTKYF